MTEKKVLNFEIIPIEEEPERKYVKGSKYDPIIDSFIERKVKLSLLRVTKDDSSELLDANYLRTQLNKRIVARKLTKQIGVTVINNLCYMKTVTD